MSYILLIIAVLFGALLVLILKPKNTIIRLLLAFSGAYLLSVTILHLLPEVYQHTTNYKKVGGIILLGIVIQSVLESFSKGAEHGHIHVHNSKKEFPVLLFVSLCVHAFSEGLPIHNNHTNLLWAIVVHKVPIAIVLATFLTQTKFSKITIFIYLAIFAFMSPLGAFIGQNAPLIKDYALEINAFIIGVFLHISTIILFESTANHKFNLQKFIAILAGIFLTLFS